MSSIDMIWTALDINGDGIFNGIDLWLWPVLIAAFRYFFIKVFKTVI